MHKARTAHRRSTTAKVVLLEWPRADARALALFNPSKQCTMNCGPHRDDPRTAAERKLLCDDCQQTPASASMRKDNVASPMTHPAPTCKTCRHWTPPGDRDFRADDLCNPRDPDTLNRMDRGFEVRICRQPVQTFCEAPVARDSFGLVDGSDYYSALVTAEDFGCVKHEVAAEVRS